MNIKYRVYNRKDGWYFEEGEAPDIGPDGKFTDELGWYDDLVLELFTGKVDCYGAEIYEGDIVSIDFTDSNLNTYEVFANIVWRSPSFWEDWQVEDPKYKGLQRLQSNSCEVVGNIHEGEITREKRLLKLIEEEGRKLHVND
jgi:hypothetical protein